MHKYKKYLGSVVDGAVLEEVVTYYDLSSDSMEYAFVTSRNYDINCELCVSKHF